LLLDQVKRDADSIRKMEEEMKELKDDFGSRKVYPRENWAILKKKWAAHPKSTVVPVATCS